MQEFASQVVNIALGHRDSFYAISQAAASTLVTAIWQSVLVAACLELALRLAPRTGAAHRFAIWSAGFTVLIALPCIPALMHLAPGSAPSQISKYAPTSQPWFHLDIRWSILLTALWTAASLYRAVELAIHSLRLRRLWKSATPVTLDLQVQATLRNSARRGIKLCTTTELKRPSVIGFLAPRILIPDWLYAQLTSGELNQIVLHEAEHLRRIDDWTNLIQKLCLVLFPLNPVLLWVERRLCLLREMACDDGVIEKTHAPRDYAVCLTSLAERHLTRRAELSSLGALSLGAWQRRSELVRRVNSILSRKPTLGPVATRSLFAVLGCGLLFGSVELSRCPQLIAFTPIPETAATHEPLVTIATSSNQNNPPVASDADFPVITHASSSRPYMTQLKAHIDPSPRFVPTATHRKRRASTRPALADQATLYADQATDAKQVREFVVLTTWREFETITRQSQTISDTALDPAPAQDRAPTPTDSSRPAPGKPAMTQLIFRVAPVNSDPAFPSITIRSGWLIIQL